MMEVEINKIVDQLSHPDNLNKPWMTARMIARRLTVGQDHSDIIESLLINYCQSCKKNNKNPLVRYSNLPSKRSLEVLWAHTDHVGHRSLCDIKKTNVADGSLGHIDELETADVFMSHSFKDYYDVIEISKGLVKNGISPWLAETHINTGEHINVEVISAIKGSACFAVFLSSNSLKSKWTGKEYNYARQNNVKIIVIADCRDRFVRSLVESKIQGKTQSLHMSQNDSAYFFKDLLEDNEGIVRFVIYPECKWEEMGQTKSTETILPINQLSKMIKMGN